MKVFNYLTVSIITLLMVACSGSGLSPVSTKINGPLGAYFEVVDREYNIKNNELNVEFKRISKGGPDNASWDSEPTFTVELLGEDDNVISSKSTDVIFSKEQLESVFSLGINESTSITLTFDDTKGAAKFKVSSKWSEETGNESETATLSGSIGKTMGVMMTLNIDEDGNVTGAYYYKKQGPKALLYLKGTKIDDNISLNEYNNKGELTGQYEGSYDGTRYNGTFVAYTGKEYTFDLKKTSEFQAVNLSDVDFDEFTSEIFYGQDSDDSNYGEDIDESYDSESESNPEDIEKMLESYEKYIDRYISLIKKLDRNDPTAMVEYAQLLAQAEDLEKKLDKVKNNMSSSQLNRYLKITNKLTDAIQKMK